MSDSSQGPGWWLASDGKWYPPEKAAKPAPPPSPARTPAAAPPPSTPPPSTPPPAGSSTPPPSTPPPSTPPPAAPPPAAAASASAAAPPPSTPPPSTPPPSTPPPSAAAPKPKSSGNGCLKAFLIVVVVLFFLGVGFFALLAFVIDRGVHHLASYVEAQQKVEDKTGISTYPLGFDSKHPPQYDIWKRPLSCTLDSSTGQVQAKGTVQNHSSHPSSYLIAVSFDGNTDDVGGVATVFNVDPGASVAFTAAGAGPSSGKPDCKVVAIYRSDNPKLAPTTTTG